MSNFPVDEAQLIALFVESVLYGIFLVSFGSTMRTLVFDRRGSGLQAGKQRPLFVTVALAFFIIATWDISILLRHNLDAFIFYTGPGGPIGELSMISYWVNVMKTVDYCIMTSIGDAVLIYRCFIVWGRNWYIVAALTPVWLACLVVAILTWRIEFTLHSKALLNASNLKPYVQSIQTTTLCLNIIATSLIIYKIYQVQRLGAASFVQGGSSSGALKRAMRIILESGALYSFSVIAFFGVYLANSNAQYVAADAVVQVIGISFNLIIIRIAQGRTIETTLQGGTLSAIHYSDATARIARPIPTRVRFQGNRSRETTTFDDSNYAQDVSKEDRVQDGVMMEIVRTGTVRDSRSENGDTCSAASGPVDDAANKV